MKHEQAPTAPKLEGVWFFVDFKYIFYENRNFWHIYGPRPFIWAYNQVSMTFRLKVLACTKKGMTDRQTDRQTDGQTPQTYRLPTFWVGA